MKCFHICVYICENSIKINGGAVGIQLFNLPKVEIKAKSIYHICINGLMFINSLKFGLIA